MLRLLKKIRLTSARPKAIRGEITKAIHRRLSDLTVAGASVKCNLGCGTRHHPDWINMDFHGDGTVVHAWDLRYELPLPPRCCDVVYTSHLIEHFDRADAHQFLLECRRVLKPSGLIRIAAPDLEAISRSYLTCLDDALKGQPGADASYEWAAIELLDQMVRHQSGGEMLKLWRQATVPAEDFVARRVGAEYWRVRDRYKNQAVPVAPYNSRDIGEFRLSGEVHQWMYDRYSLGKLLSVCGFKNAHACSADESSIEGFANYRLDTHADGTVYKPDSFFMEAVAP
jgi:predicted SAM-dependent methyltransferase